MLNNLTKNTVQQKETKNFSCQTIENSYFDAKFNQISQNRSIDNINDFMDPNELLLVENQNFCLEKENTNTSPLKYNKEYLLAVK